MPTAVPVYSRPTSRRARPRTLLSLAIAAALGAAASLPALAQTGDAAQPAAQTSQQRQFNIEGGPLDAVLNRFALEAGIDLSVSTDLTRGKTSPGLQGRHSVEQALRTLLAGSGLSYRFAGENRVTLVAAQAGDGPMRLDPIMVGGEADTGAVEGFRAETSSSATNVDAPLIETPATVNVLTSDFLDTLSARRLEDAFGYVPGVAFDTGTTGQTFASVNLRGFSSQSSTDNGILADGFQINKQAYIPDLSLYERVDILKGASSLLFGTARPGGVINYIRKRPESEQQTLLNASVGSFDLHRGTIDSTGPLNDDKSLLYRMIITGQEANQTFHGNNDDVSHDDRIIIAPSLAWETPTGGNLFLGLEYNYTDQVFDPGTKRINGDILFNTDPFIGPTSKAEREHYNATFELTQPIDKDWSLYLGGSLWQSERDQFNDVAPGGLLDGSNLVRITQDFQVEDFDQSQLRAELNGSFMTGAHIWHKLTLGIDYFSTETDTEFDLVVTPNAVNPFNPIFGSPVDPAATPGAISSDFRQTEDQLGIYIQDYVSVGERFNFFGGLRYIDFEEESTGSIVSLTEGDAIDYTIGGIYNAIYWLNPFISYSTSTEPQSGVTLTGELIDPREARQIEIGNKSEWLDGKLATTFSIFEIEQTDKAESDPLNPGVSLLVGTERVRGIELEATGQITDQLRIIAGYSYLDSEIVETQDPALLGTASANTPEQKASIYGEYVFREALAGLSAGIGIIHVGDRQGDTQNTFELPSYERIDLSLGYRRDWGYVRASLENVLDEDYVAGSSARFTGGQRITQGAPRFFTLTVGWEF